MFLLCWVLLLLTSIQKAESLPKPREEPTLRLRDTRNSREIRRDKGNAILLQPPTHSYPERYLDNDDKGTVQNYNNQYTPEINNDDTHRDLNYHDMHRDLNSHDMHGEFNNHDLHGDFNNHDMHGDLNNHDMHGDLNNHDMDGDLNNHNMHGDLNNHDMHGDFNNHDMHGDLNNHDMHGDLNNHGMHGDLNNHDMHGDLNNHDMHGDFNNHDMHGDFNNHDKHGDFNNNDMHGDLNNDDMQRDINIDKAIQEVYYPESIIRESGDILFPEYKLPSPRETETQKQKENIPYSFPNDASYLKNSILQSRYNPYLNRKPWQNEVKNPSNNEILQNILNLEGFDLKQITLKQAFLKKAETYNITEADDKKNYLLEKKVNVSTNLNYLNSNNQLANFSDFHSSVLQEIMQNDKINSYNHHQLKNPFTNHHKDIREEYSKNGSLKGHEHPHFNDFVEGQFIDEELLGSQYPRIQEPYKNDVKPDPNEEPSEHDFVAGQFVEYNNKFLSKQRTAQNNEQYQIDVQPSDFVGGQFVGGPGVSRSEMQGETNGENNVVTTMDMSSVTDDGIGPTNDRNTERYENQIGNELSSLSILGVQRDEDKVDKASTDSGKQGISGDSVNKKKGKEQDTILVGGSPKFNKGISKTMTFTQGILNEPGYNDQKTTMNTVETGNTETNTQDLETSSYSTTIDISNSFKNEMATTASNSMRSESLEYEDYHEDNNPGSIIDDGNNAKEQSDEIQGQPSQVSPSVIETTKEVVHVVPLTGVSSEKDYYNTFPDTSTQIVKDVYLYAGKDYENNPPDERSEVNEITSNSNKDNIKTEKGTKENYLTEICFPLRNKKEVSLLDILSGNLYLENNGKKIGLSLVKNPMKNCTSGATTCKLYLDVKNISQVLEGAHENEESNIIPRNKRQNTLKMFSLIEPKFKQNKSESLQNKGTFKYTNGKLNLFPLNINTSLPPSDEKDRPIEKLVSQKESKKEPTLFPNHEVTTHKSRPKRSSTDSDSCSCSSLFKSTQIPSYKYFVDKRLGILTDIVVASKHFMDSR